ncbi:hypothetical protein BVZ80_00201B, partial [Haemophilus influenzae]
IVSRLKLMNFVKSLKAVCFLL